MSKITSKISNVGWRFDNTYSKLPNTMMSKLAPIPVKAPKVVVLNHSLSKELELDFSNTSNENLALISFFKSFNFSIFLAANTTFTPLEEQSLAKEALSPEPAPTIKTDSSIFFI